MYAIPSYEDISVILPQYYRAPMLLDATVTLNTDFFPWVSYGHFAGDYPAGITTLEGVPTGASITILTRAHGMRWDAMPVRRVKSGEDGIWRAEGIEPGLRYRVMGDKEGYNSVIADNVEPMNLPRFLPDRYEIDVAKPLAFRPRIVGGIGDIELTHTGGILPQGVSYSDGEFTASWPTGPTGDYPLEFELADEALQRNPASITLALKLLPLEIISAVPKYLEINEPMKPIIFTAQGGEGPYTFSTTGDLPSGLMFADNEDGTATLSGTPDTNVGYVFTVAVEDVRNSTTSSEFTVKVSAIASYRYWRVNITANNGHGRYLAIAEMYLRDPQGGVRYTGGTVSASSEANSSNTAALAFDDDLTTKWTANGTTGWLQYDLGETKPVVEVALRSQQQDSEFAPKDFTIEARDNPNDAWKVLRTVTGQTGWLGSEVRAFSVLDA